MKCRNGDTVHIRKSTRPEPRQQVIYDALGLSHYPGRIIKKRVSANKICSAIQHGLVEPRF